MKKAILEIKKRKPNLENFLKDTSMKCDKCVLDSSFYNTFVTEEAKRHFCYSIKTSASPCCRRILYYLSYIYNGDIPTYLVSQINRLDHPWDCNSSVRFFYKYLIKNNLMEIE